MPIPKDAIYRRTLRQARGRRIQRDDRAVAAVIGTLLSLLVFMTLFGLFLTQFLPLWMTDNEAEFADTVAVQLGQVKQCMDLLALYGTPGGSCSTPIVMQSGGIPIFASPTQGTLNFEEIHGLTTNVSFNQTALGVPQPHGNFYQNFSPAQIVMSLPNRYYIPVTYAISDGALFQDQGSSQQTMLYQPSITVSSNGATSSLSMILYGMYGTTTSLTTTASNEVYVSLFGSSTFTGSATALNMTFFTYYPCAWQSFFAQAFNGTSLVPAYSPASCPSVIYPGELFRMELYVPTITTLTLTVVSFTIHMGIGNTN